MAASALLLAGCTGLFASDPTAAPSAPASTPDSAPDSAQTFASVTCHPSTTRFAWSATDIRTSYEAVSTRVVKFGASETSVGSDANNPDYAIDADQAAFGSGSTALAQLLDDQDAWIPVLAGSLQTSTLAPADIGQVATIENPAEFHPPTPHTGKWVRAVVARVESYRFTMTCQDGTMATGRFGGAISTTAHEVVLHCDTEDHPGDSARLKVARAQCTLL